MRVRTMNAHTPTDLTLGSERAGVPRWSAVEQGVGRPVVFLHGYPLNHLMWEPQLRPLSLGNHIILLDLPGYGLARDRPVPEGFWPYVDDVGRTLVAHLTGPAVVVGHSFGGYLVQGLYHKFPELFAAMVLADTRSDPDTPKAREARLSTAARLEDPSEHLNEDEVVRGLLAPATWAEGGAVVERVRTMVREAPSPTLVRTLRAIADRPDLGPILPTIDIPTLVIWGTEDQLIPPAQSEAMARRIRGSTELPVPDAGHLPSLEAPEPCNDALRRLLDRLPPWGSPEGSNR
jgi:3-oxoadipate enol-lactonase